MPIYQLLVRIKDKTNPTDSVKDAQLTKRGDVIHVAPEGHQWGKKEVNNPDWAIIKTELTEDEAQSLLAPELKVKETDTRLRKRAIKLDLDSLLIPADIQDKSVKHLNKNDVKRAFVLKERLKQIDDEIGPSNENIIGPS